VRGEEEGEGVGGGGFQGSTLRTVRLPGTMKSGCWAVVQKVNVEPWVEKERGGGRERWDNLCNAMGGWVFGSGKGGRVVVRMQSSLISSSSLPHGMYYKR
jgi:hypothetical protein